MLANLVTDQGAQLAAFVLTMSGAASPSLYIMLNAALFLVAVFAALLVLRPYHKNSAD